MRKKKLISFLQFTLLWCLFHWYTGSFSHLSEAPRGVHQGAQCDRASIALNYYHNHLNLLYPEVHENRCKDGIVSCELPLSNYLAACLYTLFGFSEKWFRLLTFLLLSAGMYGLFRLLRLYVKAVTAFALVFLLNASPIVLFYATGFLPDATALGLIMLSWYLYFRMAVPHTYQPAYKGRVNILLFVLITGLAIAVKTTCIIQWGTMATVLTLSYIKGLKIELINRRQVWQMLLLSLLIPLAWQLWARHLGNLHNSEFFMMHIPLLTTMREIKEAWSVYLGNWPAETFTGPLHYLMAALFALNIFLYKYITKAIWWMSTVSTIATFLFMQLMIKQFMYHDYYMLCLLPVVAINWLALIQAINKLREQYWWVKIAAFVVVLWALKIQLHYGRQNLADRYTPGNYWEQSQQNTTEYAALKKQLLEQGINHEWCTLVGYDGAPNNMLYLLDLRGRRINSDFNEEQVKEAIMQVRAPLVISTDSAFTARVRPYFSNMREVAASGEIKAYKVSY